jgi:hypothetical protein
MSPWCESYTVFDSNTHYYLQLIKTGRRQWIRLELLSRIYILAKTVQPAAHSHREPQAGLTVQPNRSTGSIFSPGTASWAYSSAKPFGAGA